MPRLVLLLFFLSLVVPSLFSQSSHRLDWNAAGPGPGPWFAGATPDEQGRPIWETAWPQAQDLRLEVLAVSKLPQAPSGWALPERFGVESQSQWSRGEARHWARVLPLRRDPASGQVERLDSFRLVPVGPRAVVVPKSTRAWSEQSRLASGRGLKISVEEVGVCQIGPDELRQMGFEDPARVLVFGFAGMLPHMVSDPFADDLPQLPSEYDEQGLRFFNAGHTSWQWDFFEQRLKPRGHLWATEASYFLSEESGEQRLPIAEADAPASTDWQSDLHFALFHYEKDSINLLHTGQEWLGEGFDVLNARSFNVQIPHISTDSAAYFRSEFLSRSGELTNYQISLPAWQSTHFLFPVVLTSVIANYVTVDRRQLLFQPASEGFEVSFQFNPSTASDLAWLNYFSVGAWARMFFGGGQQPFYLHYPNLGNALDVRYTVESESDFRIWDVSDPSQTQEIPLEGSSFSTPMDSTLRLFWCFDATDYRSARWQGPGLGWQSNQNLHAAEVPDMLIVSAPELLPQAQRLAELHQRKDGLNCLVITPDKIYNEFSSGNADLTALRNFARMLFEKDSQDRFKYLLLVGDGSYDNLSREHRQGNTNLILTYQSEISLREVGSFVSDDYLGLLEPGEGKAFGLLDLGIGRLPVRDLAEATVVVDKIEQYMNARPSGGWQRELLFMADDGDDNLHMRDADRLATKAAELYPDVQINKVYFDAYPRELTPAGNRYPQARDAINQKVNQGALLLNYVGHASEINLGGEQVLTKADIAGWQNQGRMPIFITATCEFSRFDDPGLQSGGEEILLRPQGGGIALFTTTRKVFAAPNFLLNNMFYDFVFASDTATGQPLRMGDIIRLTKVNAGSSLNKRNFLLLGDPALQLAYPKRRIALDSLQRLPLEAFADTLMGRQRVVLSGSVLGAEGQLDPNFEGVMDLLVFDKAENVITYANTGGTPFSFWDRRYPLHQGQASVRQGRFEAAFVLPEDIAQHVGAGRFALYAHHDGQDAMGSSERFLLGGTDTSLAADREGPSIRLFLDDERFVFGGIVPSAPTLLAHLADENGLNAQAVGFGREMLLWLDQDPTPINIQGDFRYLTDSYQEGRVERGLPKLDDGPHSLRLQAWDNFGNSSTAYTEFMVLDLSELVVERVFNYPNPFTRQTAFYFEHNQPGQPLEVRVEIFSVSGKLVRNLSASVVSSGNLSQPIAWDGLDDFGDPIGRGTYLYRISIEKAPGERVVKMEKLVILR